MRPARLARAWCARQLDDQRTRRPCRKLLQKTFDRRNVSEGMEAIAVDAKLARGLWSAQHQYGEDGHGLRGHAENTLDVVRITHDARAARFDDQRKRLQRIEGGLDIA